MEDRGEFPRRLLWTEMPSSGGISSHAGEKDRAADTAARAWVIDAVLSGALSCLNAYSRSVWSSRVSRLPVLCSGEEGEPRE